MPNGALSDRYRKAKCGGTWLEVLRNLLSSSNLLSQRRVKDPKSAHQHKQSKEKLTRNSSTPPKLISSTNFTASLISFSRYQHFAISFSNSSPSLRERHFEFDGKFLRANMNRI
jgi:hypothetical protein